MCSDVALFSHVACHQLVLDSDINIHQKSKWLPKVINASIDFDFPVFDLSGAYQNYS